LGAATADALYALFGALGLTFISARLVANQGLLQLGGGFFLLYLGINLLRAKAPAISDAVPAPRLAAAFLTTFLLTLANPLTIFSFVGIFAGFGSNPTNSDFSHVGWLISGVFIGSAIWWTILSSGAASLAGRISAGNLLRAQQFAALIFLGFGIRQLFFLLI
jgi:threonine/homoserine/homoserine lactone efflux protein